MSRLTIRLPEALHEQLSDMAKSEGVSLNQYIVYALTREVTLAYTVRPTSASEAAEQRAAYTALLQGLGQASFEEIKTVLGEREEAAPEGELSPRIIKRFQERLEQQTSKSAKPIPE